MIRLSSGHMAMLNWRGSTNMNQQNPSIKFIIEEERENQLPFLDVFLTLVYRKSTHTDRYINFNSHHHSRVLRGTVQCLRDRAHNVCDTTSRATELKHLHGVFAMNRYPKHLTRRTLRQKPRTKQPAQKDEKTSDEERKKRLFIYHTQKVTLLEFKSFASHETPSDKH